VRTLPRTGTLDPTEAKRLTDALDSARGALLTWLRYGEPQTLMAGDVSNGFIRARELSSTGWSDKVDALENGMYADLIAVDSDPVADIKTLRKILFVMNGGKVVNNEAVAQSLGGSRALLVLNVRNGPFS
jgi:hypothetical protein